MSSPALWRPLLIDGNAIKFLHSSLLRQCEFLQREDLDGASQWRLTFFKNSPYEISIHLHFFEALPVTTPVSIGKSIWLEINYQSTEVDYQACLDSASFWLRESATLGARMFEEESMRHVAVDNKGIAFISPRNQESTFSRSLILQALAYAYLEIIADLSQQLASALANGFSMREIYLKLVMFNAQCFLHFPVVADAVALPRIWDKLRDKFNIDRVNKELTRQVHDLSQILAEQARDDAARQDRISSVAEREKVKLAETMRQAALQRDLNRSEAENKRNRIVRFWGGVVSAGLAAVSILQALQAPPSQLYENLMC